MNRFVLCMLPFCLYTWNALFAETAERVHIENGVVVLCTPTIIRSVRFLLHVRGIERVGLRNHFYLMPDDLPGLMDLSRMSRFPSAWTVKGKTLKCIFPDVVRDAMGRIAFGMLTVDDVTDCEKKTGYYNFVGKNKASDGIMVYKYLDRSVPDVSSCDFGDCSLSDFRTEVIWYGLDGVNFIVRVPIAKKSLLYDQNIEWVPCVNPVAFRWKEFRFTGTEGPRVCLEELHSQDIPPDGYSPIGCVRVVGKRILCDDPMVKLPTGAEWLIWEENNGNYRLCQMRGGRWSVYQGAARKDAPKTIVVNNDANAVFLSYSIRVNPANVDRSLEAIIGFLRTRNALTLGERPVEETAHDTN